jgi:GNAT superfamily N-acetyltransferase
VGRFQLRAATLDDVEAYVRCHVECLAETYATVMPPAFAEQHRHAVPHRIDETRRSWAAAAADPNGPRAWLATDEDGLAVGVARSGPGPQQWERDLGAPPTTVTFELHHIYTRQHTHGSGLGRSLLEAAVGERDAYLWILHGNERAERFYRRHAFEPDGTEMSCGPSWFHRSMFRMVRRGRPG